MSTAGSVDRIIDAYLGLAEEEDRWDKWFHNPVLWAKERCGIYLWRRQAEIAMSVARNNATAVKAGHAVGKSFVSAVLTAWWIDTRTRIGSAFVATTAPSFDQVTGVLWREIRYLHEEIQKRYNKGQGLKEAGKDYSGYPTAPLPGYITMDNKWIIGKTVVAQGRKPPDNKAETAFQGFHADYVLAIGDEACGLSEELIDNLDNITNTDLCRKLTIANPTDPASYFAKMFRDATGAWNLMTISCLESPKLHGGGICGCHPDEPWGLGAPQSVLKQSGLVDQSYIDRKKLEYGEDSARYKARILGEFAWDEGMNLFSELDLALAKNCIVAPDTAQPYRMMGVDVARSGRDYTILYMAEKGWVQETDDESGESLHRDKLGPDGMPIPGLRLRFFEKWRNKPLTSVKDPDGNVIEGTAERVHELAVANGIKEVRVDMGGLGSGVMDRLSFLCEGKYALIEIWGSAASDDKRAWLNKRAQRYDQFRRRCFAGEIDIDPEDEELLDELGSIQYGFSTGNGAGGAMIIESKDSMKKRGVSSPDHADAAYYTCIPIGDPTDPRATGGIVAEEMQAPDGMGWWLDPDSYLW